MHDQVDLTSICGVRVPRILYGTAWKKTRTEPLVAEALGCGFRGIDTACQPKHYDEAGVGRGVAAALSGGAAREEVYLQTKYTPLSGQDPARVPYDPNAPLAEQVAQSVAASLRNLQTGYLDALILHSPIADAAQMADVWQAMERAFDAGTVRQLGISNCYALEYLEHLYAAARVKPAVVQNRFYRDTGYDARIRAFCRRRGVLYQSFWTLTANPHLLAAAPVARLAAKYGRTPAQILFRYLTQEDVVPLTGTTSRQHMREDLSIFEFELGDDERSGISALLV